MDGLSGVASGMAVTSLAVQLLQSVGTIRAFIRDVKGASKELDRLAELLDRLRALLEDVRDVMERQTALQGQHFPAPSNTIFSSLKSCEESLRVLDMAVEKYTRTQGGNISAVARLKQDVKFGFKTKDIAGFEARIQKEIEYLHAALGLNTTSILTTALPALLQNQQACMTLYSQRNHRPFPTTAESLSYASSGQTTAPATKDPSMSLLKRDYWVSSSLKRFGIHQRVSMQYFRHGKRGRHKKDTTANDTISESREILLIWRYVSFGLQWTRQNPYGSIAFSLRVYPVVDSFFGSIDDYMENASIYEIQQMISSGTLHPFTRNSDGESLLHIAASYHRADVCRLLLQCGLRPDQSLCKKTPLMSAIYWSSLKSGARFIDICRLFLLECDQAEDVRIYLVQALSPKSIEWLWINAGLVLYGDDLLSFRCYLLRCRIYEYHFHNSIWGDDAVTECIVNLMDEEMIQHYLQGKIALIENLFWYDTASVKSQRVGSAFIDLLTRLGLDVEACINMELENYPGGLIKSWYPYGVDRRIVFDSLQNGGWILGWTWDHDPLAAGHILVSEHIALGADNFYAIGWPFSRYHKPGKVDARRERREAAKARKERARTGQKRTKSKMPGTWSW